MDENAGMIVVYTTFPNESDARKIGQELVEEKLAACVNLFPGMLSIYRWQGISSADTKPPCWSKREKTWPDKCLPRSKPGIPTRFPLSLFLSHSMWPFLILSGYSQQTATGL